MKHLNLYRWTFGNHEPLSMYRRIGGGSTGGVTGGALWLDRWHEWYDSEACVEMMAEQGFNILHCRFYKGMGWEFEEADFPKVRSFAERCRRHGITVLGYVQFSTLYYEIMQREVPHLRDWAARGYRGELQTYMTSYWRWMPCINHPEFVAYLEKVLALMLDSGCFDGVLFDNIFGFHCYCDRCREGFREHLRQCNFDFIDPDFAEMPPPEAPPEIMDPIRQEMLRFQNRSRAEVLQRIRGFIKARNPEFIISANFTLNRRENYTTYCCDPQLLAPSFDLVLAQSGNEPGAVGGCVISQVPELKMARALGVPAVPLTDADAAGLDDAGPRYVCGLFENLFGGSVPVDRTVMKPLQGGAPDLKKQARRRPVLAAMKQIGIEFDELLNLPDYEPVGLLYAAESIAFSQRSNETFLRAEASLLRGHVPFRRLFADASGFLRADWKECETIIIPDAACLSDRLLAELKDFRGRLVLAGEHCGEFNENYRQRPENPFKGVETVPVTPHEILSDGWLLKIRHHADDWSQRFPTGVELEMPPEAHAVIKWRDGVIAAILITAPVALTEVRIRIRPELRAPAYSYRGLTAQYETVLWLDDAITFSAPDGMAMLIDSCFV